MTPTDDRFVHEIGNTWEEGEGEGHALYAQVQVTDTGTGETYRFKLRNAVDIGWQAFREDQDDLDAFQLAEDSDLSEALRTYLRENSPIYTGHRQYPEDGTLRGGGTHDRRGWPY